ncbi:MAG TPA: glutamate racemase [Actinomycetota bacterium]|nr:glutamate racemase [Actinomycetota bacterium]
MSEGRQNRPIGVFDSGVGGLTVARSILDLLPGEALLYVADTARYPYGPRPVEEIRGFALEIASYLVGRGVKMLVVACNSVEVAAIEDVAAAAGVPVIGVVDPGARAAVRVTHNRRIGMIGTEATVASGAYDRAVARTAHNVELFSQACPEFVEYVERGDTSSPELFAIAEGYLAPLRATGIDTLILGCTHYPLLSGLIANVMGREVALISSADETAKDVYQALLAADLTSEGGPPEHEFVTTGDPSQFRELASTFLGPSIPHVHQAVPGGFRVRVAAGPWS